MTDPAALIRDQRARSNAAIAARDADGVVALMHPDVTVAVAGGPTLTGRDASRVAFAQQFADRSFRGYVREPEQVTPADPPVRASERGQWVGRWHDKGTTHEMRGVYTAEWMLTDAGWMIRAERFVEETARRR